MKTLSIDIETFSGESIKSGTAKYVESPDFEILLFCYSIDGSEPVVIDFTEEELPANIYLALWDRAVLKTSHNAFFECNGIAKHFGRHCDPEQWECTMVKSAMVGLPMALDAVAKALKLEQQKQSVGKALIKYFCTPCSPTAKNGMRTRNMPHHDLVKWEQFKEYNRQDVVVENAIRERIKWYSIPQDEKLLWNLDQDINMRGITVDVPLAEGAIAIDRLYRKQLVAEAIKLTGLENPNSVDQIKGWLNDELREDYDEDLDPIPDDTLTTLNKNDVADLLKNDAHPDNIKRVLEIRQELAKTSIRKYPVMLNYRCSDGKMRGIIQFYGAGTGRWAGRGIQPHNLRKIEEKYSNICLSLARQIVKEQNVDELEYIFGSVSDILSQLIRTGLIASPGNDLLVADFKSIEARILSWLAKEQWRLDVFNGDGKIYEAAASRMFHIPLAQVTKELRGFGKIGELALGYQGAEGAIKKMDTKKQIPESKHKEIVTAWRAANPKIVQCWYRINDAAVECMLSGQPTSSHGLSFRLSNDVMFMRLPSGRELGYWKPSLKKNKFDKMALSYMGLSDKKQWVRIDTYGGKLVENAVQAMARDCLVYALFGVEAKGYNTVLHVHDEIVADNKKGVGSLEEMLKIMSRPIPWAPGLPMGADGFIGHFYKK